MKSAIVDSWFADHSRYGHQISGEAKSVGPETWICSCGCELTIQDVADGTAVTMKYPPSRFVFNEDTRETMKVM